MKGLTRRQFQVLVAIDCHREQFGCSPTIRELVAAVGCASTNGVHEHLHWLELKGMVDRGADGKSRQTRLTARGKAAIHGARDLSEFKHEQALEELGL